MDLRLYTLCRLCPSMAEIISTRYLKKMKWPWFNPWALRLI